MTKLRFAQLALGLSLASTLGASELALREFETDIIQGQGEYAVLLPDGYPNGGPYPLVLMLHGAGSNRNYLARVKPQVDGLWSERALPPVVIATASVPPGTIYMDDYSGENRWETFMIEGFLPHLRKTYKVSQSRERTIITGISMGGAGSLRSAFKYPELFGAVASMEPGIWPGLEWRGVPRQHHIRGHKGFAKLFGDPVDAQRWRENNPASIANTNPQRLKDLEIYIECGDLDAFGFLEGTRFLHNVLWDRRIRHEYRQVRWSDHIGPTVTPRSLDRFRFIARYLEQPDPADAAVEQFRKRMADRDARSGFKPFPFWPETPDALNSPEGRE